MFLAMNRFRIAKGFEEGFEQVWAQRESYLKEVPGFVSFALLKGNEADDHTLYVRSGFEFASKEVFIDKEKIREERHLENIYKEVFHRFQEKRIATELDLLPANEFLKFQRIFKGFEFLDVSPHVLEQRKRKDPSEIERIKEACDAIDTGHRAVLSDLKEGTTELEIAAAVENARLVIDDTNGDYN